MSQALLQHSSFAARAEVRVDGLEQLQEVPLASLSLTWGTAWEASRCLEMHRLGRRLRLRFWKLEGAQPRVFPSTRCARVQPSCRQTCLRVAILTSVEVWPAGIPLQRKCCRKQQGGNGGQRSTEEAGVADGREGKRTQQAKTGSGRWRGGGQGEDWGKEGQRSRVGGGRHFRRDRNEARKRWGPKGVRGGRGGGKGAKQHKKTHPTCGTEPVVCTDQRQNRQNDRSGRESRRGRLDCMVPWKPL